MHTVIGKEESPQEGFEYFKSEDYLQKYGNSKPALFERFTAGGVVQGNLDSPPKWALG